MFVSEAQLSEQLKLSPAYLENQRYAFNYSPVDGLEGSLKLTYFLTGADYIKTFILDEQNVISGNIGGMFFRSGYLKNYSLGANPNSPVQVNSEIVFFEQLKGTFAPTTPTQPELEILNVSNVEIDNLNGFSHELTSDIQSFNYNFTSDIRPVYTFETGTGLSSIEPTRIMFGPKEVVTNVIVDLLSGDLPITGKNAGIKLTFKHPNLPNLSESITSSGRLVEKNINSNINNVVRNSWTIIQHVLEEPPQITAFAPLSYSPGDPVLITGTNFNNTIELIFNDETDSSFRILDNSTISGNLPLNAVSGPIKVRTFSNEVSSATDLTIASPNITIASITPTGINDFSTVTISGTNFYRVSEVVFSGYSGTTGIGSSFRRINDKVIQAVVPASAAWGRVRVVSSLRSKTGVSTPEYVPLPSITGIRPVSGMQTDTVLISGYNFSGVTGVFFNGVPASGFTVVTNSGIVAFVPTGNTKGFITVIGFSGVTGQSANRFSPIIRVTGVTPLSGKGGETVTISGQNFRAPLLYASGANTYKVSFAGGVTGFFIQDATKLTGILPTTARTGPVYVFDSEGRTVYNSNINFIRRKDAPIITKISPKVGYSGTYLKFVLEGENFFNIQSVRLTGVSASSVGNTIEILPPAVTGNATGTIAVITGLLISGTGYYTGQYDVFIRCLEGSGYATGQYTGFMIKQYRV